MKRNEGQMVNHHPNAGTGQKNMKRLGKTALVFVAGSVLGLVLGQTWVGYGQDGNPRYRLPEGVYLDLNREFYQALKEEGGTSRSYSNDMSLNYLREISISTRFMVETNLQILKTQERLIQLLEPKKK
ncbi:MAG: hypothetical protein AB1512_17630 [Thermodesulfobacteriota bacterium]